MILGSSCEETDVMPLGIPAIDGFDRVGINFRGRHPLRFLIWDVFSNSTINVDEVVLTTFRQDWTYLVTILYGADPDGIVITGLSNGGFMSHRMACDAGGSIRAIVALNGVTWDDFSKCPDTGRPDILHVHSTADTVIAYLGYEFDDQRPTSE